MQEARFEALASLCHVPLWTSVPALFYVLLVQQRGREAVGEVLATERDVRTRLARLALPVLALAALFAGCAAARDSDPLFRELEPAFECLGVAVVLAWWTPCAEDRCVGRAGLQLGWSSARWEELDLPRFETDAVWVPFEGVERRIALTPAAAGALRSAVGGAPDR